MTPLSAVKFPLKKIIPVLRLQAFHVIRFRLSRAVTLPVFPTTVRTLIVMFMLLTVATAVGDEKDIFDPQKDLNPAAENAAGSVPDGSQAELFETRIRPILANRCYECHSSETGPDNGDLILDSIEGIAAGGSRGEVVDREHPEKSRLLVSLSYRDTTLQMPPAGKLPPDEIDLLEKWVHEGARLPVYKQRPRQAGHQIDYEDARQFWSFRPLREVAPPAIDDEFVRDPIDAFVLAELQKHELRPGTRADRRTLIRRLTFDLIGLPPSPAEIRAFLEDSSPDAVENLVDRLLASPQFGIRWARHWLDLARYTDFTPDWQNPTDRGWIYRDWVVAAINDNLPFDEFVRLQLAADLLPDTDPKDLAALGFLGLSPTYWKELQLAPPVIEQIVADEWDERIDAVSRTFLGLTVSCARCHDHKFDPISMEDYYALAGVFASTQLDERPLLSQGETERLAGVRRELQQLESRHAELKKAESPDAVQVELAIRRLRGENPNLELPLAHVLREASVYVRPDGADRTKLDYEEGRARDLPIFRRGNPSNPGDIVPRRFLMVFCDGGASERFEHGSGRAELADALVNRAQGLMARVIVNRIWDQHFGAGLVRTPSDFGAQGDFPTHPGLLEYLAGQLVSHHWDLKWLHRRIVLSSTYLQSGEFRSDAAAVDPSNQWLWRNNRRRLEFEMWRDAILTANGRIDLSLGGPPGLVDDPEFVRRGIFLRIDREELHPVLRMHDFPEASSHSPRREPTITPLQQLFVLNSPWFRQQADAMTHRILAASEESRLDLCFEILFARLPSDEERKLAETWLADRSEPPEQLGGPPAEVSESHLSNDQAARRWNEYLQVLLGINEFFFVD